MTEWERLDPKMLLVGPLDAAKGFVVPIGVGLVGLGTQQPGWLLWMAPLAVLGTLAVGALPWLTTRYQVSESQLVMTTGLVRRSRLTAPLDRIRSVDLEAPLLHRLLGLQKVQVGTGVDDSRIELDSLSREQAEELRRLLAARSAAGAEASGSAEGWDPRDATPPAAGPQPEQELARLDPAWARFAPFSLGRLVVVAGVLGVFTQAVTDLDIDLSSGADTAETLLEGSLVVVGMLVVAGALVAWTLFAVAAYLIQWWDLRLTRQAGSLHLTRGLFTTTSTTIEEARIRGVRLRETALLRTVGGSELSALATGLEEPTYTVLPPAPVAVSIRVADEILADPGPVRVELGRHGPVARRRCWLRRVRILLVPLAALVAAAILFGWSAWVPLAGAVVALLVGVLLGEAEYAHLGHALADRHLVAGAGVTSRIRTALEREGIIGWVVRQTWFQRRAGVATLVATTAAGDEQVLVRDLRLDLAVALADAATPGMLSEFRG